MNPSAADEPMPQRPIQLTWCLVSLSQNYVFIYTQFVKAVHTNKNLEMCKNLPEKCVDVDRI